MDNSKIEWTHHTANLWHGCAKVHAGCDNCYAEKIAHRYKNDIWGAKKPRKIIADVWDKLKKYQSLAEKNGQIHRVFVGSMMDIFEKDMPLIYLDGEECGFGTDVLRRKFFEEVIPHSPNLHFLLLTKRPGNINKYIPESWKQFGAPDNVMFGTSPVDQETWDMLVPKLKDVNGQRFVSVEPQLGDIHDMDLKGIDWVIQGGESGPGRRPFNLEWAVNIRSKCESQNAPYFFKQIDKKIPIPAEHFLRQFPTCYNSKEDVEIFQRFNGVYKIG